MPKRRKEIAMVIMCSRCGAKKSFTYSKANADKVIKEGWGSFGSALYCPECTKSWPERNPDRPQPGDDNTRVVIKNWADRRKRKGQWGTEK